MGYCCILIIYNYTLIQVPPSLIHMASNICFGTSEHDILSHRNKFMFGVFALQKASPSIVTYFRFLAVRPTVS